MFQPTNVRVITAEDGQKAIAVELVLLLPLEESGVLEIAGDLLNAQPYSPEAGETTENTDQESEESNA